MKTVQIPLSKQNALWFLKHGITFGKVDGSRYWLPEAYKPFTELIAEGVNEDAKINIEQQQGSFLVNIIYVHPIVEYTSGRVAFKDKFEAMQIATWINSCK